MNELEKQSSYKSIFKATSLFGGVQVYQILIGIIKSKVIAIILGPSGMGIQGLFTSAIDLVKQFTSFGLSQSAVRDISSADSTKDAIKISVTVKVLRRIVWLTGSLGCIAMIIFSSVLSNYTFGNSDFAIPFVFLSVVLLLDQICSGQKVILQGLRRLKDLAKATAYGSTIGLVVCIPLYYLLGVNGIVPTIILNSITALVLSWIFSKKIHIEGISITNKIVIKEGRHMVTMGLALSISSILMSVCSYAIRSYIRNVDGTEAVGLFTAGFVLVNTYVGMVFNAMGTDFYPRLSMCANDDKKCMDLVCKQCEIGLLILAPLLITCLVFTPIIVNLLYSSKFEACNAYVLWASSGMFFKLMSWCVSYQFIAKGASKIFVTNEILQNSYTLLLNIIGYKIGGLLGLGISFTLSQVLYFFEVYLVSRYKYHFAFSLNVIKLFVTMLLVFIFVIMLVIFLPPLQKYIFGTIVIMLVAFFSIKKLITLIKLK